VSESQRKLEKDSLISNFVMAQNFLTTKNFYPQQSPQKFRRKSSDFSFSELFRKKYSEFGKVPKRKNRNFSDFWLA